MRLWFLSDLHLELTRGWDLPAGDARPDFDVMIVAGDLIPRMERGVSWLRDRVPDREIIIIAGSHEPYGQDIDRGLEKARAAAAGSNVHVLQNDTVTIEGITFVGATLWTDFDLFGDQPADGREGRGDEGVERCAGGGVFECRRNTARKLNSDADASDI
jgi:hypothetical protein